MKPKSKKKPTPSMFKIEIEKGIPIPESLTSGCEKYPFRRLKIGDSFLVPEECRTRKQIATLTYMTAKKLKEQGLPREFTVRFFPVLKGTRIWRTK